MSVMFQKFDIMKSLKSLRRIMLLFVPVLILVSCRTSEEVEEDSVVAAQEKNEAASIDESISDFLTEATDARMMDLAQGKLAIERGTTAEVRKYGALMVKDQTKLLEEIRRLARTRKVALPKDISFEKEKGLEDLTAKTGSDFDKKFMQMMTIDHRRDVRKFRNAEGIEDAEIAAFASRTRPVIEKHLEQAKEIRTEL
jgi:putative membrane protein